MIPRVDFGFQHPPERLPPWSVAALRSCCVSMPWDGVAENANLRLAAFDWDFLIGAHWPALNSLRIRLALQPLRIIKERHHASRLSVSEKGSVV